MASNILINPAIVHFFFRYYFLSLTSLNKENHYELFGLFACIPANTYPVTKLYNDRYSIYLARQIINHRLESQRTRSPIMCAIRLSINFGISSGICSCMVIRQASARQLYRALPALPSASSSASNRGTKRETWVSLN